MTQSSLPSYTELTNALKKAGTAFQAAEVHGYICGLLCAAHGELDNSWQKRILGQDKNIVIKRLLEDLYEHSYQLISEFSFEFNLLLPGDRQSLSKRTEALSAWCQGFLAGLKQFNIPLENRESSDVTNTLNDIIEIAKVNYGELKTNEEDETAYFELVEYVRLAVIMLFQELNPISSDTHDEYKLQ